jgi:hypothetical protein
MPMSFWCFVLARKEAVRSNEARTFDLPDAALQAIQNLAPPRVVRHGASDYEFLPVSFGLLNFHTCNRQVVPVP